MNSKRKLVRNTAEEDAEVLRQANEDADNPPVTAAEFAKMRPFGEVVGKRMGRPPKANPKEPVSVRYDPEVLVFFRSMGEGWQTRMNDVLLDYVREHAADAPPRATPAKPARPLPRSGKR
jgi:uncharacterized protein (DUF4415 family)